MIQRIFQKHLTFLLLFVFVLVRALSFFTYASPLLNQIIALILIFGFFCICVKKLSLGWTILVMELLLDGAGHFFELQKLILRTWFLGIFGGVWLLQKIKDRKLNMMPPKFLLLPFVAVLLTILFSALNGLFKNHVPLVIFQDAILYFFILLFFPAQEFFAEVKKNFVPLVTAFIIGSALLSLFAFILYSSGEGTLPDLFYHWFRNVAGGKITDLGDHFFRVVLSEHIFLIPILLVLASSLMREPKNKKLWLGLILSSLILVLNFSRIYFIALAAGLLILAIKNSFKRWLLVSSLLTICLLTLFSTSYFLASRGESWGLPLLGLRIGGATSPQAETSGAVRLAILPEALKAVKAHPWLGNGLGSTVTYVDPISQRSATRTQFDWGYLEMLVELGIIGSLVYISFLFSLLFSLAKLTYVSKNLKNKNIPLLQGLIAGAISLFAINLTTPALFQGFGVLYFVFILAVISTEIKREAHVSS